MSRRKLVACLMFAGFFVSGVVAWASLLVVAWTYLPTWAAVAVGVPLVALFSVACVVGARWLTEV